MTLPTLKAKKRLLFLMTTIIVLFFGLAVKMGIIVFVQGEELQEKALIQQTRDLIVSAKRGDIRDRNGNVLAQSATAQTVVLRPAEVAKGNVDAIVSVLAEMLDMDEETVRKKATDETKSEVWLARQITNDVADEIRKLNLPGVYFTVDVKRYYTNSSFLTQTLGFTSVDGIGQEGIEAYFEKYLAGQDGSIVSETDSAGREIALGEVDYIAAVDGYNVDLCIDEIIQSFLEQALEEAYYQQNAESAYGIVMDPDTGEILAIANIPDYDLNDVPRDDIEALTEMTRNKILVDAYEPGSTFKVVTLAAALDSGAVTVDTEFYCPGYKIVDGQQIKCWRYPNSHGQQTLYEAVQNSCNVAFMQMALLMETETFYDYIYEFGFGQETGITFPSDGAGIIMPEKYVTDRDLARIAFGQSIAVTPLQLISSFCAVVNGGFLYQPLLVHGICDSDGNYIEEYEPTVVSQPISEETSAIMRDILESVVTEGSGSNCYIPGYRIGGKTGTAQKYDDDGNVMTDKHIASFIAFAPADDPEIAVLIIIDEPDVAVDFGSVVAAPYVRQVLEESLQYMGIMPDYGEAGELAQVAVPDVAGMSAADAADALDAAGLSYLFDGTGDVTGQLPAPGEDVDKGTMVWLYMETKTGYDETEGMVVVPDLTGKTVMEAAAALEECHLTLSIDGQGIATYQSPSAGEIVEENSVVRVEFRDPDG
ncbi:MAG: penicillin-binding transpeptidase domain-containing protein [Eubacteriales bacterium]|nr:penicillin-binding transpeptidase domain-containing protein [Eubacteriales bacterium]